MKVLVLGATGLLGWHTLCALRARGHEVGAVARRVPPPGVLPADVAFRVGDVERCTDDDLASLLDGWEGVVVALGLDDRKALPIPAEASLRRANVETTARVVARAVRGGTQGVVVFGSYLAYLDRLHPDWRLSRLHPYVRSRRAQAEAACAAGGARSVTILELPYVFGSAPGRVPLWAPVVRYVRSRAPLCCIRGGTSMVAVGRVAEAATGALERRPPSGCHPVADEDLTWARWLETLAGLAGRARRATPLPPRALAICAWLHARRLRARGLESGLDPVRLVRLLAAEAYVAAADRERSRRALGFGSGGLEAAFVETIRACP